MSNVKFIVGILLVLLLSACEKNTQTVGGTNINDEFLPVEKAFEFSSQQIDASTIQLNWNIAEGYHLYKNKFEFKLEPETARIADVQLPKGEMLDDKTFGLQESYTGQLNVVVKLKTQAESKDVKLITKYQGCSEKGLCYPPEKREIVISL